MVSALFALAAFWKAEWSQDPGVDHLFSTEVVDWKRRFVEGHFKPRYMFKDVGQLAGDWCKDELTGRSVKVPWPHVWASGFECDTVSGLNKHRKHAADS